MSDDEVTKLTQAIQDSNSAWEWWFAHTASERRQLIEMLWLQSITIRKISGDSGRG